MSLLRGTSELCNQNDILFFVKGDVTRVTIHICCKMVMKWGT